LGLPSSNYIGQNIKYFLFPFTHLVPARLRAKSTIALLTMHWATTRIKHKLSNKVHNNSQFLAGFWKNGWFVVSVTCQSVRSQPASGWLMVGLIDRSAER